MSRRRVAPIAEVEDYIGELVTVIAENQRRLETARVALARMRGEYRAEAN